MSCLTLQQSPYRNFNHEQIRYRQQQLTDFDLTHTKALVKHLLGNSQDTWTLYQTDYTCDATILGFLFSALTNDLTLESSLSVGNSLLTHKMARGAHVFSMNGETLATFSRDDYDKSGNVKTGTPTDHFLKSIERHKKLTSETSAEVYEESTNSSVTRNSFQSYAKSLSEQLGVKIQSTMNWDNFDDTKALMLDLWFAYINLPLDTLTNNEDLEMASREWGKLYAGADPFDACAYLEMDARAIDEGYVTASGKPDRRAYIQSKINFEYWNLLMSPEEKSYFLAGLTDIDRQFIRSLDNNPEDGHAENNIEKRCTDLASIYGTRDKNCTGPARIKSKQINYATRIILMYSYCAAKMKALVLHQESNFSSFAEYVLEKFREASPNRPHIMIAYASALTEREIYSLVSATVGQTSPFNSPMDKFYVLYALGVERSLNFETTGTASKINSAMQAIVCKGAILRTLPEDKSAKFPDLSRHYGRLNIDDFGDNIIAMPIQNNQYPVSNKDREELEKIGIYFEAIDNNLQVPSVMDFTTGHYKMIPPPLRYLLLPKNGRTKDSMERIESQYRHYMENRKYYNILIGKYYANPALSSSTNSPVKTQKKHDREQGERLDFDVNSGSQGSSQNSEE